jgi:DNA-binding PadR family transcriptional regulator
MPPRRIGLYALATMEREGAIHGYGLAQRIADRTAGAWRPGAGAIYPSLQALVERGLARSEGSGRRREYRITPAGRALLRQVRSRAGPDGRRGPDLAVLWAEVVGVDDLGEFLLLRLRRSLDAIVTAVAVSGGPALAPASRDRLRGATVGELERRLADLGRTGARLRPAPAARRPGRRR